MSAASALGAASLLASLGVWLLGAAGGAALLGLAVGWISPVLVLRYCLLMTGLLLAGKVIAICVVPRFYADDSPPEIVVERYRVLSKPLILVDRSGRLVWLREVLKVS